jgi:uroporphyrinogen-III decarboxylase
MPDVHFDLNAFCIGHLTKTETDCMSENDICALPEGFVTEAEALGARITETRGGFPVLESLYHSPAELAAVPRIDETLPVARVLEKIAVAPCRDILLKVSGPYSVLSSVVESRTFYRWLRTNEEEVEAALERITMGLTRYISGAISAGARVISLADPYANPDVLGPAHYRRYAAASLIKLLDALSGRRSGLIHLCPHTSVRLERHGCASFESAEASETCRSYIGQLFRFAERNGPTITGHVCVYSGAVSMFHVLERR